MDEERVNTSPGEYFDRSAGRELYGQDPAAYDAGRLPYPERVWDVLRERCGLASGSAVVEIGPGTGTATRRVAAAGAAITAVEPNRSLAAYLRATMTGANLSVIVARWEDVDLREARFDVVVAATSFHWIDSATGLAKVRTHLRPGGWFANWWTLYENAMQLDEFGAAARAVLGVSWPVIGSGQPAVEPDEQARVAELVGAGFVDVRRDVVQTEVVFDARGIRALYASLAIVLRRSPREQVAVLDDLEALVQREFDGRVARLFVTELSTSRTANLTHP